MKNAKVENSFKSVDNLQQVKPVDKSQQTCCHKLSQAMRTHPDIGLSGKRGHRHADTDTRTRGHEKRGHGKCGHEKRGHGKRGHGKRGHGKPGQACKKFLHGRRLTM